MKWTLTSIVALLIVALAGIRLSATPDIRKTRPSMPDRVIDMQFIVDNTRLLDKKVLEFAFRENHYTRRMIQIPTSEKSKTSTVTAEVAVPDGPLNMVICGVVKCAAQAESEMACAETPVPASVPVDKIHQIHYS